MIRTLTAALLGLLLLLSSARASVVVNGSFEDPLVPAGSFTNFAGGSTAITGWTVVGVDSAITSGTFTQSGITFQAADGAQWLDLAGVTSNNPSSGVRQDIPTTPGADYEVNFSVGSAAAGPFAAATVDLTIGGGPRVSYFNPTAPATMLDWKSFSVLFTATGATTSLTFQNGSAPDNFLSGLDGVSVNLVPEPGAALLVMALLTASMRRQH